MTKRLYNSRILKIVLFCCGIIFFSCKSTSVSQREFERFEPQSAYFITDINDSLPYSSEFENGKFIFLRFYHITYGKNFRIGNLWRSMLGIMGNAPDGNYYSHVAINFNLTDNFIGSTMKGKNTIKREKVTDLKSNVFLKTVDASRSSCTVVAIPCTEVEWENCKALIEYAQKEDERFAYNLSSAFFMPIIYKQNMTKMKKTDFSGEDALVSMPLEKEPSEYFKDKRSYICTGFIMKVLSSSIAKIGYEVETSGVNINGFLPGDFFYMDGFQKLFTCRFEYYNEAVEEYLALYPQFREYF
ncbi:MAG: hypothetical protein HDR34_10660 [Treponema sp.]|nr:hypothetical protein [Treponema sp.]